MVNNYKTVCCLRQAVSLGAAFCPRSVRVEWLCQLRSRRGGKRVESVASSNHGGGAHRCIAKRDVHSGNIRTGNIGDGDVRPHQRYVVGTESLTMGALKRQQANSNFET